MKRSFAFATALAFLAACQGPASEKNADKPGGKSDSFAVLGKFYDLDTGKIYLMDPVTGTRPDSAMLDHGYFRFGGRIDTPRIMAFGLRLPEGVAGSGFFFLEPGKIAVLAHKDSMGIAKISGTPLQDSYAGFEQQLEEVIGRPTRMLRRRLLEEKLPEATRDSLNQALDMLAKEHGLAVESYVRKNAGSPVAPFAILMETDSDNDSTRKVLYDQLTAASKNTFSGKQIKQTIDAHALTAVGAVAPDFVSTDLQGKPLNLSSLRGQYVLLDFWASWCGPCRQENPSVVKSYARYHPKGLQILGVSLDEDKAAWEKAVAQDKLVWQQVSSLKGWEDETAVKYGVSAIPMNFLLDKQGVIVAKNLRGEALEKKLAAVFP